MSRSRIALLALLAAELASVVLLHRLGAVPGLGAVAVIGAAPDDALMAAARLAGLAVAWWLLAGTLGCLAAAALRPARAAAVAGRLALPAVRRLVERATAVTLSASLLALGPGGAAGSAAAELVTVAPAAAVPAIDGDVVVPPGAVRPGAPPQPRQRVVQPGEPRVHVVRPGEHLWAIAAATVAGTLGAGAPRGAVAAYWSRLVAANRPVLRSGDPDVIYPGERITLPPVEPA